MAQGLEIVAVGEFDPVAAVRYNVVNVRCPDAAKMRQAFQGGSPGAFAAEGLTQELTGTKIIPPDGKRVPGVPGGCIFAAPGTVLGAMFVTAAGPDQLATTRMRAGAHSSQGHSYLRAK